MDKFVINIDDYSFRLEQKIIAEDYVLVKIVNINLNHSFYVYRSNSELGVFRFAVAAGFQFDKGDNYVTTTNIHHRLQQHLIENLEILETINTDLKTVFNYIVPSILNIVPKNMAKLLTDSDDDKDNEIFYSDYINIRSHFEPYLTFLSHECNCGKFYYSFADSFLKCLTYTYAIIANYNSEKAGFDVNTSHLVDVQSIDKLTRKYLLEKLDEQFIYIIKICKQYIEDEIIGENNFFKIKYIIDKLNYNDIHLTASDKFDIGLRYIQFISEYLKHMIIIDKKSYTICSNEEYYMPKTEQKFNIQTYTINGYLKKNEIKYLFYCMKYSFKDNPVFQKNYHMIINIVPFNSKINSIGLYDSFIDMGPYICKAFEYIKKKEGIGSFLGSRVCHINEIYRCFGDYGFIGDIIDGQFPTLEYLENEKKYSNYKQLSDEDIAFIINPKLTETEMKAKYDKSFIGSFLPINSLNELKLKQATELYNKTHNKYEKKYLKYKQKYLELKNKLN